MWCSESFTCQMKAVIQSTKNLRLATPKKRLKGAPCSVDAKKVPRLGLSGSQTTVIEATIVLRMNDYVPGGQKWRFKGNNILIISPKIGNPFNGYRINDHPMAGSWGPTYFQVLCWFRGAVHNMSSGTQKSLWDSMSWLVADGIFRVVNPNRVVWHPV